MSLGAAAAIAAMTVPAWSAGASSSGETDGKKPTLVLVHGAFTDSSSWNHVVQELQGRGYRVLAPANPLRGLAEDSSYLSSFLKGIEGPIILVGHSYGGEVIGNAAAGEPKVKGLVYVAAIAPDIGESANDILGAFPGSVLPDATTTLPYSDHKGEVGTDLYVKPEKFREAFAGDLPAAQTDVMAAIQRPIEASSLGDSSTHAAWKEIPSWYLVASEDKAVPPDAQRFMAQRAMSQITEVSAAHAVAVSRPDAVTQVILDAIRTVRGS
ncbi:alpha/beta fold hydrolase [Streptomyces sp. NRRL F-2664]|uniref:alpha/beta fold hydrolase n=1 Tax=Streptomyces sp. NRRL F-2664 TaxID=1463842 RepID=UPI001F2C82F4|nr:alpha/beta hydrolase [Streptomyces sp. NRRL F-2664]